MTSPARTAVVPGSFDPVTRGHVDIVERACRLFASVRVGVLVNPSKQGMFDADERLALLRESLDHLDGVVVEAPEDRLLVDYCRRVGAVAVVKGVRSSADVEYETPMVHMNRHLSGVETVLLAADPATSFVSSSLVKEVAGRGGDVDALVPEPVARAIAERRASGRL